MNHFSAKPLKRENELKAKLVERTRIRLPGFVLQLHQQVRGSGTPDLSLDGLARGSWWEVKHATPDFLSPGIQEVTCCRLAAANFCRYIIYFDDGHKKQTRIVHPVAVRDRVGWDYPIETFCVGIDHEFVIDYMEKRHGR